jgi:hypothetical protein
MKLASLCGYCLVSIAYALIPNQASAFELSLECEYLGPVINGTPNSGLVCELTWNPSSNHFADYADYTSTPATIWQREVSSPSHVEADP